MCLLATWTVPCNHVLSLGLTVCKSVQASFNGSPVEPKECKEFQREKQDAELGKFQPDMRGMWEFQPRLKAHESQKSSGLDGRCTSHHRNIGGLFSAVIGEAFTYHGFNSLDKTDTIQVERERPSR